MTVMRGSLRPGDYFEPKRHAIEEKELFHRTWQFAGYASELANPNDYRLVRRGGVEIILQNLRGEIRAFRNVCPHRFSRIHCEKSGNRSLICPYHGWTFNHEGRLTGLPQGTTFGDPAYLRSDARLHEIQLRSCGNLLFVALSSETPSFEEYFGERVQFLESVGAALDERIDEREYLVGANWKTVIENSLEGYHVPFVHPSTINAFQGMSRDPGDIVESVDGYDQIEIPSDGRVDADLWHTFMKNNADRRWLERFRRLQKISCSWPFQFEHYIHQLVFPNLTITSFLGYSFHIQHFEPRSCEETAVRSSIFTSKFEITNAVVQKAIFDQMFHDNIEFTAQVFREDEKAVALVQSGLRDARSNDRAVLSQLEKRIKAFQSCVASYQGTN